MPPTDWWLSRKQAEISAKPADVMAIEAAVCAPGGVYLNPWTLCSCTYCIYRFWIEYIFYTRKLIECVRCSINTDIPSLDYRYQAMVNHQGSVHWVPAAKFRSFCQIDMRRFPFDEQRFLHILHYYAGRVWRPPVCLSHFFASINRTCSTYSTGFTRRQHATPPAYITVRVLKGRTYVLPSRSRRFRDALNVSFCFCLPLFKILTSPPIKLRSIAISVYV